MISKECVICNKPFEVFNYRKDSAKYCSHDCFHKARKNVHPWNYSLSADIDSRVKDNGQKIKQSRIKNNSYNAWNDGVYGDEYWSHCKNRNDKKPLVHCANCGRVIEVSRWRLNKYSFIACSDECRIEYIKKSGILAGENNIKWRGGWVTHYRGPNWYQQRMITRKRDNYICKYCGSIENGRKHSVHHITPYHKFDNYKQANELDNLITLCQKCHMSLHSLLDINESLYYGVIYDLLHPDEMLFDIDGVYRGEKRCH